MLGASPNNIIVSGPLLDDNKYHEFRLPKLNTKVVDINLNELGTIKDIFGPVKKPFFAIKPKKRELLSSVFTMVGQSVYTLSQSKNKSKTKSKSKSQSKIRNKSQPKSQSKSKVRTHAKSNVKLKIKSDPNTKIKSAQDPKNNNRSSKLNKNIRPKRSSQKSSNKSPPSLKK
ncbi:MAG: H/ACA ribonucleoprotein complex subunit GAR1 [Promethearchaeota archaeon]